MGQSKKKYKILAINTILNAVLVPIISISLGLIKDGPLGLFMGLLFSQVVPPLIMLYALTRNEKLGISIISRKLIMLLAKKHINFPKFSLSSELINRFSNQLPVFMLSTYSGAAVVGVYNLAIRMLDLPVTLISSSVGEVFRQKATEDFHNIGNCRAIFVKVVRSLSLIAIVPFFILIFFGPDLFGVFFGEEWKEAGRFGQILGLLFVFRFIVRPTTYLFVLADKLKEDFYLHVWMLISTIAVFYIGFNYFQSLYIALGLFSANYIIIYSIYLYRSYVFSLNIRST